MLKQPLRSLNVSGDPAYVPTCRDFPEFYAHPMIQKLAPTRRWTISNEKKIPIDVNSFIYDHRLRMNHDPLKDCTDLGTICRYLPTASNHAFYMDTLQDGFILADIEPGCPDDIKQKFLDMDYLYGEVSLSGRGYHLIFAVPECFNDFPNAKLRKVLKDPEGGRFEIMLNHWVTFTRRMIAPNPNPKTRFADFYKEFAPDFDKLAASKISAELLEPENIENFDSLQNAILESFEKNPLFISPNDFLNDDNQPDLSRYEYNVLRIITVRTLQTCYLFLIQKQLEQFYDIDELATMIWKVGTELLDSRPKHEETRDGVPFLLYESYAVLSSLPTGYLDAKPDILYEDELVKMVQEQTEFTPYTRTPGSFSSYFGYLLSLSSWILGQLRKSQRNLLRIRNVNYTYTDEENMWLLYDLLSLLAKYNPKQDSYFKGEPYLLNTARFKVESDQKKRQEHAGGSS